MVWKSDHREAGAFASHECPGGVHSRNCLVDSSESNLVEFSLYRVVSLRVDGDHMDKKVKTVKIEVPPPPEGGWHITLTTAIPHCCPICGAPWELSDFQKEQFEQFQVAICINGMHIFQKITVEAALLAAAAVGSDLKNYVKNDP